MLLNSGNESITAPNAKSITENIIAIIPAIIGAVATITTVIGNFPGLELCTTGLIIILLPKNREENIQLIKNRKTIGMKQRLS